MSYFGKGCPHFSGQFERDGDGVIDDSMPELVICNRRDNPDPDVEGNCNINMCPLGRVE